MTSKATTAYRGKVYEYMQMLKAIQSVLKHKAPKKQQKSRHIGIVLSHDYAKQRLYYLLFEFLRQFCLEILLAGLSARFISIPPLNLQ